MSEKNTLYAIKFLLLILVTSIIVVNFWGEFTYSFRALTFNISFAFHHTGQTMINIPPLGQITAATHDFPIRLIIQLQEIDIYALEEMAALPEDIYSLFIQEMRRDFSFFIIRLLLTGVLASITVTAIFFNTHRKTLLMAGLITLLFLSFNLLGVYFFYQPDAFAEPVFSGTLSSAPWMMDLISESLFRIEELSLKMQTMADNLYILFEKIEGLEPLKTDGEVITILHVSDIHNNVVALNLIQSIVDNFNPDFIIDTGDMVDYGTPLEAELVSEIQNLKTPYIFLPGNHDSPRVTQILKQLDNVIILKEKYTYNGLRIVGVPDPLAAKSEFRSPTETEIEENTEQIKKIIQQQEQPPHIIAVHNHQIAHNLKRAAPLVLHGHTHSKEVTIDKETIILNAGTTGASGIRSLETTGGTPPYTMILLRIKKTDSHFVLQALDKVTISDLDQGFVLKRILTNRKLIPPNNN